MDLRLSAAIALGKVTAALTRSLGRGGGTVMPGRVARAVAPGILSALAARLSEGTVVVAGTNGKTTTAHLLAHIMRGHGRRPVHNRAGANLAAGITAALVERSDLLGRPRGDLGIFEVDEATVPRVVPALAPRMAVFTNLFRDQLDRYGEIDHIAALWRSCAGALPRDFVCVANADDPLVHDAVHALPGTLVTFGVEDDRYALPSLEHTAEARYCYRCGTPYTYTTTYFGHMGHYRCDACGTRRPIPDVVARDLQLRGVDGSSATLEAVGMGRIRVHTVLPGLYNVYNLLAATAAALQLGASLPRIAEAVASFRPAFGRAERVRVGGREVNVLLVKNPAGFNEVLRTVLASGPGSGLLIAINDLTADGRDVSWLWDVDFELLVGRVERVVASGLRAEDLAVRLLHAGLPLEAVDVVPDFEAALRRVLDLPGEARVFVLPTYTAMLGLRRVLERWGAVGRFWE